MSEPAIVFDSMQVKAIIEEALASIRAAEGKIDLDELVMITMWRIANTLEEDNGRPIL